ncbi:MAG: Fic family protein, partial [Flavobacteriia bacterium]
MWDLDFKALHEANEKNYERLFAKLSDLVKSRPLPAIALNRIKENMSIEWTYNSNSIEGNTLTLRETQLILQDGITVKGKSLREHFEAHNHDKAIDLLYGMVNQATNFRCIDILSLHSLVLRSIE